MEKVDILVQAQALYENARGTITQQIGPLQVELRRLIGSSGKDAEEIDDTSSSSDGAAAEKKYTQQERDRAAEIRNTRSTLRDLMILLHRSWFMMGDVYHQKGEEWKEQEGAFFPSPFVSGVRSSREVDNVVAS